MITATTLTTRTAQRAAKQRLAASSVAPVYASASSYARFCVISNANAYCFSRSVGTTCSGGDLV